jgi:hypothetical protein
MNKLRRNNLTVMTRIVVDTSDIWSLSKHLFTVSILLTYLFIYLLFKYSFIHLFRIPNTRKTPRNSIGYEYLYHERSAAVFSMKCLFFIIEINQLICIRTPQTMCHSKIARIKLHKIETTIINWTDDNGSFVKTNTPVFFSLL